MSDSDGPQNELSRRRSAAVVAAAVGVLTIVGAIGYAAHSFDTGGSAGDDSPAASRSDRNADTDAELIGSALVLQSPEHGPEFCLGGVMESYPPQCGGLRLVGWDWSVVEGDTHAGDSIWGDYVVIGTYYRDAGSFTPTRPPVPADEYDGPLPDPQWPDSHFTTPCDAPEGGWAPIDVATTTEQSLNETIERARARHDFGDIWVDQSINPAPVDPEHETELNDPRKLILNISVTGDIEAATSDLRETWGGALCVSHADHTMEELQAVSRVVCDYDGMLSCDGGGMDHVGLYVTYDDGSLQQELDQKYGVGTVHVGSALRPYPGG
jgi:hypothetical protein